MPTQRSQPEERRRALAELLQSRAHPSQEQLVAALRERGFAVTQATVSRDLEQLGAVKERQGYSLPPRPSQAGDRLTAIVGEWVRSVAVAGNLLVLKTPPGSAHLVGVALDEAGPPEMVGNICGDDTIFIAVADPGAADLLAQRLRTLLR
ncbi:arginine repressor [Sphingomonas ginkgonis]|uniref:arginine repressor n=1 Tax=Sphingomonas ginkgonis TaxID=2315330 RepID=UPI001C8BFABC|nr:hypothetical protein [Sphingomonas ginkgonis]